MYSVNENILTKQPIVSTSPPNVKRPRHRFPHASPWMCGGKPCSIYAQLLRCALLWWLMPLVLRSREPYYRTRSSSDPGLSVPVGEGKD